jgi:hypothetical protein
MVRKWIGFARWAFLAMSICTFLFLGMGAGSSPDRGGRPAWALGPILPGTPEFDAMMAARLAPSSAMSDLSLAMRENVDFLLTPALLVQEAVSDGVVLTYPEE